MTTNTLLAVDGNSLVHRSFHALASSNLRTADGRPTWAIKGFCSQMLGALGRVGASGLVVGFDDHGNNARKKAWPHYKATRKPKPPELGQQLALTIELLQAAGIHVVVPDGLEADDVLASAARAAAADGWRTVIVTSDRDSFALVDESTSVLRIINGGVDASPLLNNDRMTTYLNGLTGAQYREYAALRGDSSDNLAGMPGFGEKTATKLLLEFGTVQAAFDDVDHNGGARVAEVMGKACVTKLAKAENRAAFAETVAIMTMHNDVDLGLRLGAGGAGCLPIDADRLLAALDSFELASVRNLAVRSLTGQPRPAAEAPAQVASPTYAHVPPPVPAYGDEIPWPDEPPADDYYPAPAAARAAAPTAPAVSAASPTAGAMAGSTSARPAQWEESLF